MTLSIPFLLVLLAVYSSSMSGDPSGKYAMRNYWYKYEFGVYPHLDVCFRLSYLLILLSKCIFLKGPCVQGQLLKGSLFDIILLTNVNFL